VQAFKILVLIAKKWRLFNDSQLQMHAADDSKIAISLDIEKLYTFVTQIVGGPITVSNDRHGLVTNLK
jgi:hypothetical protein